MKQFDLVIYDMDGVIIDSEPFWRQVEIRIFGSVGLTLSEQDCLQTKGLRLDEVVEYWYQKHPWPGKSAVQIHDEIIEAMADAITNHAGALPGVLSSLEYFKANRMRIALASSSPMRLIKAAVQKLHIENYFELLVSAEHERFGKPHPAVFIRTAETLNISPEKCLVIEDSFNGLLAAKAAKMKCIIIPDEIGYNDAGLIIADAKLKSLDEIATTLNEW